MAKREKYSEGTFSWADLTTTDLEGAKAFYGKLFGWKFVDKPVDDEQVYSMAQIDGANVSAIFPMDEAKKKQGVPPHFTSYITVDDVDVKAMEVEAAAGEVLAAPFDVFDAGRMAVAKDTRGAVFALWQPEKNIGAERVNEPGCLCWNELNTRDPESAQEFYSSIFDWSFEEADDYISIKNQNAMNGGMLNIEEKAPSDVPEHWNIYFGVKDCDETAKLAKKLGGSVVVAPMEIPAGRFSVLKDPQGATFSIIQLD